MPETTQAGPCGELHEKLSACVSANVSTVSTSENGDKNFALHFFDFVALSGAEKFLKFRREIFGINAQFHF